MLKRITFFLLFVISAASVFAQYTAKKTTSADGKYTYTTFSNDPLGARIYTLQNGLTVYLSVMKNEPRIQTVVAVRAGSKHDPSDATVLAHYLEHMLFKGTDRYGTLDIHQELPLLMEIERRFEEYRHTTDPDLRKKLYHQIDSVSGIAAKYAIANEFDKMVSGIGARGTNASTWFDYTRYVNDIPSNQLKKWLTLESERYRNPQMRLFHTELEAVYEEKNRSIDDDNNTVFETMLAEMFKNHTYGTQTTIGTVEHLKNPSIVRIREYFMRNYVPNNMCIALSGDFDPDETIKLIDEAFAWMAPRPVPILSFPPEEPITSPIRKEVMGPDPENLMMGFRFPGINTHEADMMRMVDMILANSKAGLIDLNLNQKQKVLSAGSWQFPQLDYSMHFFFGNPLEGQKLEEVEKLLLGEIEKVKKGEFDDALMPAIINDIMLSEMRSYESNNARANNMADAYINFMDWDKYIGYADRLSKITKKDIMEFAKKHYNNNYVIVYKRIGKRDVPKVEKPAITPVAVNREAESPFLKDLLATPAGKLSPRFLDYKTDIKETKIKTNVPVFYLKNNENQLFTMYYKFDMGQRHDKKLAFALNYLDLLGTTKMSPADVKKKLYSLGLSFGVSATEDECYVYLSGLQKNFAEGVKFFEDVLANVKGDDEALQGLIERELKVRDDSKRDKSKILFSAMMNYGSRGKLNPVTDILTEKELRALTSKELITKIKDLIKYPHRIMYYGPAEMADVVNVLAKEHHSPATFYEIPNVADYPYQDTKENKIYFVNFDMAQAEVIMLSKEYNYDAAKVPVQTLYNEYFGGGMSSIVFQEIRESKALAYATWSGFSSAKKKGDPNYMFSYIGTQADKLPEALTAMNEILTNLPKAEGAFSQAKDAIMKKIESERITRTGVLMNYENAKKLGLDSDIRRSTYASVPSMTFDDIKRFQEEYIKNNKYTFLVLGSRDKVDMKKLSQWGTVQELTLEEVFGY
jgi:predicted Zn-dependent peptidase